ncbi:MAG TPA: helix-turn-helix transcriptional regulator [Syntrophomonadaceae bacterium]|nr:helix-turn-helix transcriptional regulator [Syntrophomonadaceae bacterium]
MSENIGKRVKTIRTIRGMTQKQLATQAAISRSYLADIESGRYNPSLGTLQDIANALNVSIDLLTGELATEIIEDRLEELNMTLEEVSAKANVPLNWLESLNSFSPWGIENEQSYTWITQVAEVLNLPGGLLRAALARQEVPTYDGSRSRVVHTTVPMVGIVPADAVEAVEGIEKWDIVPLDQGNALVLMVKVRMKKGE